MEKKIKNNYDKIVKRVNSKLSSLLSKRKPVELYEPCSYILKGGGKRLRPYLLITSAQACGLELKDVLNAAMAVEILHNFTLVHDDIMDNADKRRGRETLHVRNDLNTAILAGDTLFAIAYETLLKDCKQNVNSVIGSFTQAIIEVCEGQSLDTQFETMQTVTLQDYKKMIYKKTAALAEICCRIGAQLANADQQTVNALSNYGKNLGLAFQIQDDLLDIMGNEEEFGKSVGIDLVEGKKTFLFLKALEKADDDSKLLLEKVITNKGIRKNQVKKYRDLYIKLGVIDDAKKEIVKYTNNALKSLNALDDSVYKDSLHWLANFLINRSK